MLFGIQKGFLLFYSTPKKRVFAADMLAGPLGVILGGVGLYEGIKEFVDGTKEEASGTKERLSAEAENIRPNIPNPNYSGKFVAPVPKVV